MPEADLPSGFLRILTTFAEHKVAFVLVGMGAGWIHGSKHRTEDLDFLIAGDLENCHRAAMALTELGARVQKGPPPDHDDLLGGNPLWDTRHGHVDILLNTIGPGHTQLTY